MQYFLLAFSVVFPLLFYMVLGFAIRKCRILTQDTFKSMNVMIFKILIPITLFLTVYHSDVMESISPKLFIYVIAAILVFFIAAWKFTAPFVQDKKDRSVIIQGIGRSNFVLFGMIIGASLCDENQLGTIAALAAIVVPLINILSIVLFSSMRSEKVSIKEIVIEVFKNPIVEAGIFGIIFSILQIPIPEIAEDVLTGLGDMATPLALICLGGMLSFQSMRSHKRYLQLVFLAKLVIVPMIAILIGFLIGFRDVEIVAILAVFGSPTAVASVPMAQLLGGNETLAGEIVATTSAGCIITLFLFIWGLSYWGVI